MAVNQKYVELLNKTYDKYKNVDFVHSKVSKEEQDRLQSIVDDNDSDSPNRNILQTREVKEGERVDKSSKSERKNRRCYKIKLFLPEEDKIIKLALDKGDINVGKIAKKLNRERDSIIWRIKKLETTGTSRRRYKHFEFSEDCVLIDAALTTLGKEKCPRLETATIPDVEQVAASLKREMNSVRFRWEKQLRVWILRYIATGVFSYSCTLSGKIFQALQQDLESGDPANAGPGAGRQLLLHLLHRVGPGAAPQRVLRAHGQDAQDGVLLHDPPQRRPQAGHRQVRADLGADRRGRGGQLQGVHGFQESGEKTERSVGVLRKRCQTVENTVSI